MLVCLNVTEIYMQTTMHIFKSYKLNETNRISNNPFKDDLKLTSFPIDTYNLLFIHAFAI